MKKTTTFIFLAFLLCITSCKNDDGQHQNEAQVLIDTIDLFKKNNGVLPKSILEIDSTNQEMGEGPYYEKISEEEYIVFFNIGFDDQLIYNSKIKEWKEKP